MSVDDGTIGDGVFGRTLATEKTLTLEEHAQHVNDRVKSRMTLGKNTSKNSGRKEQTLPC